MMKMISPSIRLLPKLLLSLALFASLSILLGQLAQASSEEAEVFNLINLHRVKAGKSPLKTNDKLVAAARKQSKAMAKTGKLSHSVIGDLAKRVKNEGYYAAAVGENIGFANSASQMVQIWMNSQGHKQNILSNDFQSTGIGVAKAPNGQKYYTQVFAKGAKRKKNK